MALLTKTVLGLDLGSHTLKAVELRQTLRGLEPVQLRVNPRVDPDAPLSELLSRFVRLHQLPTDYVVAALPTARLSTRRLEFPFRDKKQLSQAIPFEVEGEVPFDLDDIVIDWTLSGGDRSSAVVAATVAMRAEIERVLGILDEPGCEPRILEAEGLVLANLAPVFDLRGTHLLADVGHSKTTFCVIHEERPLMARSIPVGGGHLSEALANDLGISLEEAERIKCEEGLFDLAGRPRSAQAVALLDRIAREAVRIFEAAEAPHGSGPIASEADFVLMGGSARLIDLDRMLEQRTGFRTRRLAMPEGSEHAALVAGGDPLLFGPAMALALRGTSGATTQLNFRKDGFAYRADFSQLFTSEMRWPARFAALALVLLVANAGSSIALESRRAGRIGDSVAALYSQAFPGEPVPRNPVSQLGQRLADAQNRADYLGLYGGDRSALDLLAEISARVPEDLEIRLEEINIDRKAVRVNVEADGYDAADRLINVLAASPPFEQARVAGSIKNVKGGGVKFAVTIPLGDEEASP